MVGLLLLLLLLLLLPPLACGGRLQRPSANWGGGGCTEWAVLPSHNALCKHDSVLPNSGPCCQPTEADRQLGTACPTGIRSAYPCPSCLDQCGAAGRGKGHELYILGLAATMEECQGLGSSFAVAGVHCQGLTWVQPDFGGAMWASKCICGTSTASWPERCQASWTCDPGGLVAQQAQVQSAFCTAYALGGGWQFGAQSVSCFPMSVLVHTTDTSCPGILCRIMCRVL
jgi:hypothetical protein